MLNNRLQKFLQLFFQAVISYKFHNPVEFLLQSFQQGFGLGQFRVKRSNLLRFLGQLLVLIFNTSFKFIPFLF